MFVAFAVISKYYDQIWKSFPKDHMISLQRYCGILKLDESTIDFITAAETSELSNERLLSMMFCVISSHSEDTLFHFCNNVETVIGDSSMTSFVEQLRSGESVLYEPIQVAYLCI